MQSILQHKAKPRFQPSRGVPTLAWVRELRAPVAPDGALGREWIPALGQNLASVLCLKKTEMRAKMM